VTATGSWARYQLRLEPEFEDVFVAAGPDLRGSSLAAATLWLDGVQLERARDASAWAPREAVELGFESGRFGNVFAAGEPARVLVSAHASAAGRVRVEGDVEDFFGNRLPQPPLDLALAPAGTATAAWTLALPGTGCFMLKARWRAGGVARERRLRLAVITPYRGADSPFGFNHAPVTAELCGALRAAGVVWARDWSLKWQDIEPRPGAFTFARSDPQIDRLAESGMRAICLLPPFPSANWSSEGPASATTEGYPGVRARMAYAPRDPALLARFIRTTAKHYAGRVRTWEFLNEPLFTDYALPAEGHGIPGPGYTAADYVKLLRVASESLKAEDPGCVLVGGIAGGPDTFTREFLAADGLRWVDALNLHIYPGRRTPESFSAPLAEMRALMARHGGPKPIWITEYAYYGIDELPWTPHLAGGDWAGSRLLRDERQAAEYAVRLAVLMLAQGAEKLFYHSGASGAVNDPGLENP
ncbi:MAG: glycosyl hydrolase, partial [bacterium]